MAGELEAVVRELFAATDRKDPTAVLQTVSDDVQAVDEVSRGWVRGREDITAYLRELERAVADIHTELREVHETVWGESGILTCMIEQTYTLEGRQQHVTAPTSVVLRREGAVWRVLLFHSVPLPEQAEHEHHGPA